MGSLVKCAGCGDRCGQRPIGVYWRWMRADGLWKKYYARLCIGCYAARVAPLDIEYSGSAHLTCPSCGSDTEDDYDGIYTTSFPGGRGQVDTESPFCDVHAADYRIWVTEHAADITTQDGAPEPHPETPTAADTLHGLGREDTGRPARAGRGTGRPPA